MVEFGKKKGGKRMRKANQRIYCCECGQCVGVIILGCAPAVLKEGTSYICRMCQKKFKERSNLLKELEKAKKKIKAVDDLTKNQNPFETFGIKNPFE